MYLYNGNFQFQTLHVTRDRAASALVGYPNDIVMDSAVIHTDATVSPRTAAWAQSGYSATTAAWRSAQAPKGDSPSPYWYARTGLTRPFRNKSS